MRDRFDYNLYLIEMDIKFLRGLSNSKVTIFRQNGVHPLKCNIIFVSDLLL